jgi:CheY-like chemotaxis protein
MQGTSSEVTVLIVDDDLDLRNSLKLILEEEGFTSTSASNGQNALEMLQSGLKPNVILLDLSMPVMDGIQFRKAQLENLEFSTIPTYLMTAGHLVKLAADLPFSGILTKPCHLDELLNIVEKNLH